MRRRELRRRCVLDYLEQRSLHVTSGNQTEPKATGAVQGCQNHNSWTVRSVEEKLLH
jgi:hypothetical protein